MRSQQHVRLNDDLYDNEESKNEELELQELALDIEEDNEERKENSANENSVVSVNDSYTVMQSYFSAQRTLDVIQDKIDADYARRMKSLSRMVMGFMLLTVTIYVARLALIYKYATDTQDQVNNFSGNGWDGLENELAACPHTAAFCGVDMPEIMAQVRMVASAFADCTDDMYQSICDRNDALIAEYQENVEISDNNWSLWNNLHTQLQATDISYFVLGMAAVLGIIVRTGYKSSIGYMLSENQIAMFDELAEETNVTAKTHYSTAYGLLDDTRKNNRYGTENKIRNNRYASFNAAALQHNADEQKEEAVAVNRPAA